MKPDLFTAPDYYNIDDLLNQEHKMVREATRSWVKKELSPIIEDAAQKAEFPKTLLQYKMRDVRVFLRVSVREKGLNELHQVLF